ncbi:MAG: hypothetical protein ACJ8F7_02570 [Gemmataceae bacterium]
MSNLFIVRHGKLVPLALTLLALCLGGCLRDRENRDDPLTGMPARISANQRNVSVRDDGRGASNLSIRDQNPPPNANTVQTTGWTGNNNATSTDSTPRLGAPVVGTSVRNTGTSATLAASGGPTRIRTFEEAEAFLASDRCKCKAQRLLQHEDEQNQGVWTFECSVPSRTNPSNVKTYTATDRYGLIAMQKVIDQIVQDQGR